MSIVHDLAAVFFLPQSYWKKTKIRLKPPTTEVLSQLQLFCQPFINQRISGTVNTICWHRGHS